MYFSLNIIGSEDYSTIPEERAARGPNRWHNIEGGPVQDGPEASGPEKGNAGGPEAASEEDKESQRQGKRCVW
jgi:hypothetical protein